MAKVVKKNKSRKNKVRFQMSEEIMSNLEKLDSKVAKKSRVKKYKPSKPRKMSQQEYKERKKKTRKGSSQKKEKERIIIVTKEKEKEKEKSKKKSKKGKKSKQGKQGKQSNVAKVKGIDIDRLAEINDKVRDKNTLEDLGTIYEEGEDGSTWITTAGVELDKDSEDYDWEVVYFNLYLLSVRTNPSYIPDYLPESWPYLDLDDAENNYSNRNYTNSQLAGADYFLISVVVAAPSLEDAREYLAESDLPGYEDEDEFGNPYEKSVWLDPNLTMIKYLGTSQYQKYMYFCCDKDYDY